MTNSDLPHRPTNTAPTTAGRRHARAAALAFMFAAGGLFAASGCDGQKPAVPPSAGETTPIGNGTPVDPGLGWYVVRVGSPTGGCTGTLVRPTWVLTAKHCVTDSTTNSGAIVLPVTVAQVGWPPGVSITASAVFLHPQSALDVALVQLPTPIRNARESIPLFERTDAAIAGRSATVFGFGGTQYLNTALLPVSVMRLPDIDVALNGKNLLVGANSFGQAIIPGDSGGPTFIDNQILGTTWTSGSLVYAKVFRDWVNGMIALSTDGQIAGTGTLVATAAATPALNRHLAADVNGDGIADLLVTTVVNGSNSADIMVSTGGGALAANSAYSKWASATGSLNFATGDVNGDGFDDLIAYDVAMQSAPNRVLVGLSDGRTTFSAPVAWSTESNLVETTRLFADVNGDRRVDSVTAVQSGMLRQVFVSMSCGDVMVPPERFPEGCSAPNTFGSRLLWFSGPIIAGEVLRLGDVNGDEFADIVSIAPDGTVQVALTMKKTCTMPGNSECGGSDRAGDPTPGGEGWCENAVGTCAISLGHPATSMGTWSSGVPAGGQIFMRDMNGDGLADLVNFETTNDSHNGRVGVILANRASGGGGYRQWSAGFCMNGQECALGDADGDARADAFRFQSNQAFIGRNTATFSGSFRDTNFNYQGLDWDPNFTKGECDPGWAQTGLSKPVGGQAQKILCRFGGPTPLQGGLVATLALPGEQRRAMRLVNGTTDWSPNHFKLECGDKEYVSGSSMTPGTNTFHAVKCSPGSFLPSGTCTNRSFDAGDNRGETDAGDWDIGDAKGECKRNEYIAGVSVDPATLSPSSILCCPRFVPGVP